MGSCFFLFVCVLLLTLVRYNFLGAGSHPRVGNAPKVRNETTF